MFKKIEDVRYNNSAHDTLYVLFIDDDDNRQEMYIEASGPERDQIGSMGIDNETILNNTANYKLQSKRYMDSIAKKAAKDVYKNELSSLENYKESLEIIIKSLKIKPLLMHSLFYKLEKESKEKILSINKYVNDNISQEKIEVAIPNLINIIKTLNENQDAINLVKGESKFKAKTLIEALYKKIK
tara:strand:+ start:230 stop:784 length:555 start_codon:yes stop_codon:yes gene_type:complete